MRNQAARRQARSAAPYVRTFAFSSACALPLACDSPGSRSAPGYIAVANNAIEAMPYLPLLRRAERSSYRYSFQCYALARASLPRRAKLRLRGSMIVPTTNTSAGFERLLTPGEASQCLRVSLSWLAKARMRGDGPPYVKVGRNIRYIQAGITQWIKSRQRLSTSEQ
jgi:predicted DNA-binding transcriptional regulator AlpA